MKMVYHIYTLSRCGNHAFIYWILKHLKDSIFHNIPTFDKTFRCATYENGKFVETRGNESKALLHKKQHIIVNSEDVPFPDCEEDLSKWYPNPDYKIHFLRDPLNWYASRIKKLDRHPNERPPNGPTVPWTGKEAIELYHNHLMYYADSTMTKDIMKVSYNDWTAKRSSRKDIGMCLQLDKSCEEPFNYVPNYGDGSSFDAIDFKNRHTAHTYATMDRWMEMVGNKKFDELMKNNYIVKNGQTIFPEVFNSFNILFGVSQR